MLLARMATRAHGIVTRTGLLEAGVTPEQIKSRLRKGSLIAEHRGVYRVGHRAPGTECGVSLPRRCARVR
jgi:hypothetical protein